MFPVTPTSWDIPVAEIWASVPLVRVRRVEISVIEARMVANYCKLAETLLFSLRKSVC